MVDMFAGGAISRMTVFALGIMPYISASIIMQLLTSVSPQLEAWKKEGESGRKKINQYTRYGTVILAMVQAFGMANGLQSMAGPSGGAVINPGMMFVFVTVVHVDRRHHVPDVAGRADHRARHRQRHFAHHLRRHRLAPADVARAAAGAALGRIDLGLHRPRLCRSSRSAAITGHRVLRARAASPDRAIPQAPGRQPHVRWRDPRICR